MAHMPSGFEVGVVVAHLAPKDFSYELRDFWTSRAILALPHSQNTPENRAS
jgi:hypothetical protein